MVAFSSRNVSTAVLPVARERIWALVSDPDELTELTPLLRRIDRRGDFWEWRLLGIEALGVSIAPSFTERMRFSAPHLIEFEHAPPLDRGELAGVDGSYRLDEIGESTTRLHIDITLCVELPLPRVARRVVERTIAATMQRTGDGFARNLCDRLDIDPDSVELTASTVDPTG
jgi:carbon monoxide dehydrogenase subunit G